MIELLRVRSRRIWTVVLLLTIAVPTPVHMGLGAGDTFVYDGRRVVESIGIVTTDDVVDEQDNRVAAGSRRSSPHGYDTSGDLVGAAGPLGDDLAPDTTGISLPVHQPGSLTSAQARAFYLDGEGGIAALNEGLVAQGGPARARAVELIQTRNALRTHTRSIMADRQAAELLNLMDPNRTLGQLVGNAYGSKGLVGDDLWEYLARSASRSRTSVNDAFGL